MKNFILITTIIFYLLIVSCSEDEVQNNESFTISNNTNSENSETTFTSNKISASITTENSEIVSRGICWSKNPNPTIDNELVKLEDNNFK